MAARHNWQLDVLGLALAALLPLAAPAQNASFATSPDILESALRSGVATWRQSLVRQTGARVADRECQSRWSGLPADPPGDVRTLLDEIPRQLAAWRENAVAIARWENEQAAYFDRGDELVGKARACAVERRNRRTMLAALAQLDHTLARWPAAWRQNQNDKVRRLDRVAQLLNAPSTYGGGVADLKAWQEVFRDDHTPPPAAPGTPEAAAQFAAVTRRIHELLAGADASDPAEESSPKPGHAAALVQAAEAYPREQRARRQLQAGMLELAGLAERWIEAEWRELAVDARQLDRLLEQAANQPLAQPRNTSSQMLAELKSNIENYEYYELPKTMSLRQASAEPLVYGDSDEWARLLEANPEVATSADAELPPGTLLVVPRRLPDNP